MLSEKAGWSGKRSGLKYNICWHLIGGEVAIAQNTSVTLGERPIWCGTAVMGSVSEAVRARLRLLEEHETKVKVLRKAIEDGEKSGYPDEAFDCGAFLTRMQAKYGEWV
jgi:antitoxin ParD1/3/4